MSDQKMDMAKVLAILSQPKEEMPPLENVERQTLEVPYLTKEGRTDVRKVRIFLPGKGEEPMPLIYVPHYEMGEDSLELRDYLAEGWAVACPTEAPADANGKLLDDDLVFNNAALYTLRQRNEFDQKRIALVGGSAGAYMTLMLMGQNLGICAAVANGPVANVYFNFNYYWPMAQALNLQALGKMMEEAEAQADRDGGDGKSPAAEEEENPALTLMKKLAKVPIPFIAALMGSFEPVRKNFPEGTDAAKWEAVTGVGIAGQFCNPLMVNHSTSDILVPVDQISRRCTYEKPGDSLPADFDARLPKNFPGKLKCSLEECLPEEETRVLRIPVPEKAGEESVLPYDAAKRFNINIFDDGPVEGYGSHSSRMDVGRRIDLPYLREMFGKTAAETNVLTPEMLRFQIDLYQGNCLALPAHTGVDDDVYGSLAVYREKVCRELAGWRENHSREELARVFDAMLQTETEDGEREALKTVMEEIAGRTGTAM